MKKLSSLVIVLSLIFLSAITSGAWADTIAWEGDTTGAWETGANWTLGIAPANNTTTDIASFNLATPYDDAAQFNPVITGSRSVNGLSIGADNAQMTLSGGTLTVGDGNISVTSANSTYITLGLSGAASLTFSSFGTLNLYNNSYTGATVISNGEVNASHANAFGTADGGVTVESGADIYFTGGIDIVGEELTLSGYGGAAGGAIYSSGTNSWTGAITLADDSSVYSTIGSLTFSGGVDLGINTLIVDGDGGTYITVAISGDGGLTKEGNGILELYDNSYTGATAINDGYVYAYTANAFGTEHGGVTVADGAELDIGAGGSISIPGEALTLNGIGAGSGGALYSSPFDNTWTGDITLASNSTVYSTVGGTLTLSGGVDLGINTLTVDGDGITNITGSISGTGGLMMDGDLGYLYLYDNSYTGVTVINAGYVIAFHANAFGGTANGVEVANLASVNLEGGIDVLGEALTLNGAGPGTAGALVSGSWINSWSGDITLSTDSVIGCESGSTLTLSGAISGAGLTKGGTGNLILSNDNTYTGATVVNDGILQIGSGGTTGSLDPSSAITINSSYLAFNRSDTVTQGTHFANVIDGSGVLVQTGTGTLVLNGVNTHTGGVNINSGTVRGTTSAEAFGNDGTITIGNTEGSSSATLEGGFAGTIDNPISVASGNDGTATIISSAACTFSGAVTLNTHDLILQGAATSLDLSGGIIGAGDLTLDSDGVGVITLKTASVNNAGTITNSGAGSATNVISSAIGANVTGVVQNSATSALTLSGTNLYTGTTTITAGTIKLGSAATLLDTSAVSIGAAGTLDLNQFSETIGSLTGAAGSIITNTGGVGAATLTAGGTGDTTFAGVIGNGAGTTALTKLGSGTLTLSGANSYTGDTNIDAGTLAIASGGDIAGNVNNNNGGTLDVGTNTLDIAGNTYAQATGSTLDVTVASLSASGKVKSTVAASVSKDSTVNVAILNSLYIPSNTTYTIIEGGAAVAGTGAPTTVNAPAGSRVSFISSVSGNNLILTANRSSTGFSSVAANSNEAAIGAVLDNITNPSGDMTTILNTMEGLNSSQTDSALNSMEPDTDGATLQVTQATLDQLTDAVLGRQESLCNGNTGVSSGTEMLKGVDVWAQGYGSYLHQDPRQSSQGYNANIWGTALGFDLPITNNIRAGTCFGFAQDYVRGKDNSNRNDINSYQWTIYGEYAKDAYYIDLSGSFAFNTYDASRNVAVGAINRTALADYNGQQYAAYIEGGYTFNFKDFGFEKVTVSKLGTQKPSFSLTELNLTPLVSFQYQHLYLDKYTETGANAMNLTVKAQNYDLAQSGFGIKLDYPLDTKYGKLVPELRFKWLYDWIGDAQVNTSTFNGGGGSFATNGFTPAQSTWDFGAKLTMFTKNNWTCAANYDFELKEDFYGHYGYVNAKYSF